MLSLHAMPSVPHVQIVPIIGGTSSDVFCIFLEKSSLFNHPWLMVVKAEEMVRSLGCTCEGMSPRITVNMVECDRKPVILCSRHVTASCSHDRRMSTVG